MQQTIKYILLAICYFNCLFSTQATIGIFTYKNPHEEPWDPDSIQSGIGGSEESIIYLSEELVKLNYKVTIYGNPPKNSRHTQPDANPRYVNFDETQTELMDIAIAWRAPWLGPELKQKAKKVYLWPHDTLNYWVSSEQINSFNDVLWISNWQREQWVSVNHHFSQFRNVYGNGISPQQFQKVKARTNPYSCIYGSNYARGLQIIIQIWPRIRERFPNATLDIFYGWQHYNLMTPEVEHSLRSQISQLSSCGVTEHGKVGHEELNRAYEKSAVWAYPCIAPETFCITALKAQYAGAIPAIIQGSALKETVRHGFYCKNVDEYYETLVRALEASEKLPTQEREMFRDFIDKEYTWKVIAKKWSDRFTN